MSVKKYLTLSGLTYFFNKIKTYLTSSTYLNSIGIIPNTDNSVDLGASSKNIKMIYTKGITINGTQFLPSDYVNLTTAQTIGGQKTFSASPKVTRAFPYIALNISDCDVTELPTEAKFASLFFRDKNDKNLAYITSQQRTDGTKRMCLRTHRTSDIDKYYSVNFDSDGDFYPEQNNSLRLGTPALQWNNTYTRNILIDNDINIASSLINKTSSSGVLSIRGGLTTPDGASIGLYGKDYNGAIAGNIYMTAYGNSDYTNFRIYPNGTMSVYNNSTATTKNVAMQEDVVNLTTAQTIGGVKTFSSNVIIQGGKRVTCNLDNSFIELDGGTTWGKGGSIVLSGQDRSSYTNSVLIVSKSDTNTDILQYQNGELKPLSNNTNNSSLGTPTNKWKTFNGINPGALSLPSISASGANAWIALDTTDWVKNAATSAAQKYTPPADGWLNVRVDNAIMLGLAITSGGNYMHQMVRSETPNSLALLLPVFKNAEVAILVAGNENLSYNKATFYPCQGNV